MIRNSKKFLLLILCLFILGIFTSACGGGGKSTPPSYPFIPTPEPTPEKYQLELSQTEFAVNVGETDNITVTLNGDDITETATYTVDQEAIASVEGGLITGLSVGIATVTVHADEAEADKTFTVNVIDPSLPTLEVSPTELNLGIEEEATVKVTLNGEDVTDKVNYTSDKELIATAEKGVVKAGMQAGIENSPIVATITVSLEGANNATFTVNVTDDSDNEVELDEDVLEELGYERVENGDNYDIKRIADGEIVTNLEIPAIYSYDDQKYKITKIEDIFYNCTSLESITIPNSVKEIEEETFADCSSLKEITIPGSITEISLGAFEGCTSLKTIIILNGVKSIGDFAFADCTSLESITIPNSVTYIGEEAFRECTNSNLSIDIPSSVTNIDSHAFENVNNINISETQKDLDYYPWGALHINGKEVEES